MRLKLLLLSLTSSLFAASLAQAVESGPYIGAGVGNAGIERDGNDPNLGDVGDRDINGSDAGYKLLGGFRFADYVGLEASWNDFGKADDSTDVGGTPVETEFEADGFDVSLMGLLPLGDRFDLFAKAGYFMWDAEESSRSAGLVERVERDGQDLTYGAGLQGFFFERLGVRAEYQIYDIDGVDDAWFLSASAMLRF